MLVFEENKLMIGVLLAEFHSDYIYLHTLIVRSIGVKVLQKNC